MIARRRKAGFTMIELMVVITVFGILAGVMASPLRLTILQHRLSSAARNFAILMRRARTEARATGVAHLVYIQPGTLTYRVLKGQNNSCVAQNWAGLLASCPATHAGRISGTDCFGLQFEASDFTLNTVTFEVNEVPAVSQRAICYAPSGTVFHGVGLASNALTSDNNVGGGFIYEFVMRRDDGTTLPVRRVLIPLHGESRIIQ